MVYCTICGTKNDDIASFCIKCGKPIIQIGQPEEKRTYQQREMRFGETKRRRDNIGLISFGVFLVLVGVIFVYTPNLVSEIRFFFRDWHVVQVAENIYLPAPYSNHPVLYFTTAEFCAVFGVAQIGLLFLAFIQNLSVHRKAETASSIVFWIGSSYLVYLLSIELILWFQFWVMLLILIGISLIVRAAIIMASPKNISASNFKLK